MKSIKELAWDVTEEEYRKDPAVSYSTLSRFDREGWRNIEHLYDRVETPSLTFGSAVDTLLTDGEEAFQNRFIVCEFPPLTDTLAKIAKQLHVECPSVKDLLQIADEDINRVALANNYYTADKFQNLRIKKVKEECREYFSLLTLSEGKTILSQKDYDDTITCVTELRNNPATEKYFNINPWNTNEEKYFQLKFKGEYEGMPVRCMFDEIYVDHEQHLIIPIDLKTSSHYEEGFDESFEQWRYMIQAQLYSYILKQNIEKDDYFKNFTIAPYRFIVINRKTVAPLVWVFRHNFCEKDMVNDRGKVFKNWRKILKELHYYLNNPTKYSKEAIENNYEMQLTNLQPVYEN